MPLSQGQTLNNRYRIVKLLGQGGFGAVYRAWDTNMDRPLALKENLDTSPEAQRQFKREAQILFDLSHPNLPKVIDHFTVPGQGQYLVMEFVEGEDLGAMLQKTGGPLPEAQVLEWGGQICDALEYLHSRKPPIIHRDIKPANIKITPEGKAMLVDFGIAKVYDPNLSTTAGARAVTPGYSPQEQYGMGTTDARTDVYALGATLYHLLTVKQPPESIQRNIDDTLISPRMINPAISFGTENAVLNAMQLHPMQRFQSAAELRQALMSAATNSHAQPVQLQRQAVYSATMPVSAPPHPVVSASISKSLPWKWIGIIAALGLVVLLVYVFSKVVKEENHITATSPAVAVIATTSIPFSPTFLATQSSNTPTISPTSTETLQPSFIPTETPTPTPLPTRIMDKKGVEMALIPAGEFQMGLDIDIAMAECRKLYTRITCTSDQFMDEEPVHQVYLEDYYIDLTEVTNIQYAECVRDGVCSPPGDIISFTRRSYYGNPDFDNYPVIFVGWEQAQTYCYWRGGSLPTEAQWEKAARGTDGRLYPWGDTFDGSKANFCDNNCGKMWANKTYKDGYADTAPVGSYLQGASPYGILDMAGNVWEWVFDWYLDTYYANSPFEHPTGPINGDYRVHRGGAWYSDGWLLHSANRLANPPTIRSDDIGFRCARTP